MVDVATEVIALITAKLRVDRPAVQLSDKLEDLGITSLDAVGLIFDLEEKFEVELPYNANTPIRQAGAPLHGYPRTDLGTVANLVRTVEELLRAKARMA
jgi:acyl carrier protein